MMISLIIPTCNRNELLARCLELLSPELQGLDPLDYEVIVTDDSRASNAKSIVENTFPYAQWVEGPKKGPAANRNNGARHASGDWLVFTDDDCLPGQNWLVSFRAAMHTTGNLVLEGTTAADRPKQRFDEEAPVNLEGNKLWSCNFAIKKSLFFELNGFDEMFPYAAMEDIDLYMRIKTKTSPVFVPGALVVHPWRRVRPFSNFKKRLHSHKYFAKKHQLKGRLTFRLQRTKIFIGSVCFDLKNLAGYSMKGWPVYVENCFLNFCMIFI